MAKASTKPAKANQKPVSETVAEAFKNHPSVNELFGTTDGFVFFQKGDANLHANSLKDKDVETFKRSAVEAKEKAADADGEGTDGGTGTGTDAKGEGDTK